MGAHLREYICRLFVSSVNNFFESKRKFRFGKLLKKKTWDF